MPPLNWLFGKKKEPDKEPSPVISSQPSEANYSSPEKTPLKQALARSNQSLLSKFTALFSSKTTFCVDEEMLDGLEEIFLRADVGLPTTLYIRELLERQQQWLLSPETLQKLLKDIFTEMLQKPLQEKAFQEAGEDGLTVVMFVGVNGVGKTTLIGKLAHRYVQQGKMVVIGAGDTFRAAADDQLAVWAERAGASLVRKPMGSDPGAVVFEAIQQAKTSRAQVLLLDTAGRLQNKFNLMEELGKVRRVLEKELSSNAVLNTLLVVDANTGQNALQQATVFQQTLPLTGVALTKLDGSAKGGIVLAIAKELGLPVQWVGVGEKITDLQNFEVSDFIEGLLGNQFEVLLHKE